MTDREKVFAELIEEYHKLRVDADSGEVLSHQRGVDGREYLDDTPIAPPIGYKRQVPLAEQIREMVRSERLRQEVEAQGMESFEEADDFEVGDDYDPRTPFENDFDPPIKEVFSEVKKDQEKKKKAEDDVKDRRAPFEPPKPNKQAAKPSASSQAPATDTDDTPVD